MKKAILLCGALLALTATAAMAAPGLRLQWNSCSGTNVKALPCNTNTGTNSLVGSYCAPAGTEAVTGNEMVLDLQSADPTLPDWWRFGVVGACNRASAMSVNFDGSAEVDCTDYWAGQASGGVGAYLVGYGAPNRARVILVAAVSPSNAGPLNADERYFSFKLNVSNAKTVGTGACAGCNSDVAIVLNEIKLTQPVGVGDFRITAGCDPAPPNGDTTNGRASFTNNAAQTVLPPGGGATSARPATWGSIKALYR